MADTAVAAPATFKQPSRKGKKAWRKNVDITEVQQGLEDVREEVIQGGVITERASDQLFATDVTGDAQIAKQQRGKKLLKADEILAQRSAVAELPGRKRKAEERVPAGSSKKLKNGTFVPHKELERLRMVADNANGAVAVEEHAITHDPWAAPATVTKDPRFGFIKEAQPKKEPKTLKHTPTSLALNGKHTPNVRKPHAGKSYNPLLDDWSALLEREGAAAVEAEKRRLAAEAKANLQEERAAAEAAKVEAAEQAEQTGAATDYDSAWESEWDGFQSEGEQQVFTQKQKGRKTPTERNKVKARKEREAREKWERKQKAKDDQAKRIAQIAKEVAAKDKAAGAHRKALAPLSSAGVDSSADDDSDDADSDVRLKRRRFGQAAVPEAALEVVLPEELQDSLRRLKPEGDLMQDRYRNLLINGKMEVRKKPGQQKQRKTERTEKWSYKDWKLR